MYVLSNWFAVCGCSNKDFLDVVDVISDVHQLGLPNVADESCIADVIESVDEAQHVEGASHLVAPDHFLD